MFVLPRQELCHERLTGTSIVAVYNANLKAYTEAKMDIQKPLNKKSLQYKYFILRESENACIYKREDVQEIRK